MRVYLVDGVLNTRDDAQKLLIPDNRTLNAFLLAIAWTAPNLLLTLLYRFIIRKLDVGFGIRKHLRVNVFRKFLNLSDASRREVRVDDLTTLQASSIPQLVKDGYLGVFDMIRHLGKIVCVGIFIIRTHPCHSHSHFTGQQISTRLTRPLGLLEVLIWPGWAAKILQVHLFSCFIYMIIE